jgi:hypothetical protein
MIWAWLHICNIRSKKMQRSSCHGLVAGRRGSSKHFTRFAVHQSRTTFKEQQNEKQMEQVTIDSCCVTRKTVALASLQDTCNDTKISMERKNMEIVRSQLTMLRASSAACCRGRGPVFL